MKKLGVYIFIFNILISICTVTAFSEIINGNIETNRTYTINIPSLVDDTNLSDPYGTRPGIKNEYFIKKVSIENNGLTPLTNFILIVNQKNFEHFNLIRNYLKFNDDHVGNAKRMYSFIKDNMFHASSENIRARNPYLALSYWGYTLCYHNTAVMMNLFFNLGVKGRVVGRNNHTFAEFFIEKNWIIFDGDQKMVYPVLDNRRLGCISDILKDPFVSIRVKKNGKYSAYNLNNSWLNTSRFDLANPSYDNSSDIIMGKPVYNNFNQQPLTSIKWTLYPGEKLIFHLNRNPETPFNNVDLDLWKNANKYGLGLMELVTNPIYRIGKESAVRYPIVKIIDHENNKILPLNRKNSLKFTNSKTKKLSVFMQCSKISMPIFQKGKNSISLLAAEPNSSTKIKVDYNSFSDKNLLPQCRIKNKVPIFSFKPPEFYIDCNKNNAEKIWWQISNEKDFLFIIPNFEQLQDFSSKIKLNNISQTFFNPNTTYYFRAKVKTENFWSEWTTPFKFSIIKPERIQKIKTTYLPDKKIRLKWEQKNDSKIEYMIFGSNRFDFVPDIYVPTRVIEQKNGHIKTSENKNLILISKKTDIILDHQFIFYRIISRKKGIFGNPSDLLISYDIQNDYPDYLEKPLVLQLKASILYDKKYSGGYKDVQFAEIREVKKFIE